ncbi:hypothetical protein [Bradyrhizobium ottawaense]|uniref:hypothetical protein n=1 Tax=Bradyrhizobium ottawaense TaxID=931866 RepID=UPI003D317795
MLIALTRWVRPRLRAALWRQWKTPRRRCAALIANGVSEWAEGTRPAAAAVLGISPALYWALKCILQIARPDIIVPIVLAQLLEPPCTDPFATSCGRAELLGSPLPRSITARDHWNPHAGCSRRGDTRLRRRNIPVTEEANVPWSSRTPHNCIGHAIDVDAPLWLARIRQ